jgi:hypothetical protein
MVVSQTSAPSPSSIDFWMFWSEICDFPICCGVLGAGMLGVQDLARQPSLCCFEGESEKRRIIGIGGREAGFRDIGVFLKC